MFCNCLCEMCCNKSKTRRLHKRINYRFIFFMFPNGWHFWSLQNGRLRIRLLKEGTFVFHETIIDSCFTSGYESWLSAGPQKIFVQQDIHRRKQSFSMNDCQAHVLLGCSRYLRIRSRCQKLGMSAGAHSASSHYAASCAEVPHTVRNLTNVHGQD